MRLDGEEVLYEGEPYGDFVILADDVRRCMRSSDRTLPRIVLVEDLFDCYTAAGWKEVLGCTGDGRIYMVAPVVERSEGVLWSHELTHYFGATREDDACGSIGLPGFSLERPDAGP